MRRSATGPITTIAKLECPSSPEDVNRASGVVGYKDGTIRRFLDVHGPTDASGESRSRDRAAALEAHAHDLTPDWNRSVPTAVLGDQSVAAEAVEEMDSERCDMRLKAEGGRDLLRGWARI